MKKLLLILALVCSGCGDDAPMRPSPPKPWTPEALPAGCVVEFRGASAVIRCPPGTPGYN
jgi:hypothetical protein